MTYNEFKAKWLGKPVNYDNFAGAQCMDVYRMYVKEVLNVPQSPPVAGAKNVWDTYLSEYFDRVLNTPDGVPEQGCIAIWGHGTYGHVGVVDSADKQYLTCFEQNWVEMDGSGVSELRKHTYANVLGWLKPKQPQITIYKNYDLSNVESMKVCIDKTCEIMDGKYIAIEQHNQIINELDSKSTESANQYGKEKSILEEKVRTLEDVIQKIQDDEHSWSDKADVLERKLKAILEELLKVDLVLSIESDASVLASAVSQYISNAKAHTDDVLGVSRELTACNFNVSKLQDTINNLKKKESAIKQLSFGKYIIKIFNK